MPGVLGSGSVNVAIFPSQHQHAFGIQRIADAIGDALADPGLYARDAKAFADKSQQLAKVEADLAAAEERWLELEILREEIEGS